jgi:hypothetical protein
VPVITRTAVGTINQVASTSHAFSNVTIAVGKLAIIRFTAAVDNAAVVSSISDGANTWNVAIQRQSGTGDVMSTGICYCVLTSALSAATVTMTTVNTRLGASLSYFDADVGWLAQASVLDKTAGQHNTSGTAWASSSTAAVTQNDELAVGCATNNVLSGSTSTPTSPWTEETDAAYSNVLSYQLVEQWQQLTAGGSVNCQGTWSGSEISEAVVATFKTAAAAVAAPLPPVQPRFIYMRKNV